MRSITLVACLALTTACGGEKGDSGDSGTTGTTTAGTTTAGTTTGGTTTGGTTTGGTTTGNTMTAFDLSLSGANYQAHIGQDVHLALWDDSNTSSAVATWQGMVDTQGEVDETQAGVLMAGHSYTLYYYAEHSGDSSCTPPPADHGWSVSIAAVAGDVNLVEDHNTNFDNNVCDAF